MNEIINEVFQKYSKYNYIDADIVNSNYNIKSQEEFDDLHGGICWDFIKPISSFLSDNNIVSYSFFTGVYKNKRLIASHTYVIASCEERLYWIECAWQDYKGIHIVDSFSEIEELLKEFYNVDEVHTSLYNPYKSVGLTANEFIDYVEDHGVELS